jgi:replicative DNA helicase
MKALARELDIPVVLGSQLSRNVERREDKRPILSDLAESGSIEAEADLVCMLYRGSYYERKKDADEVEQGAKAKATDGREAFRDEIDIAELIVAKHRNGPVGTVKLGFKQDSRIFENISSSRDAEVYGP